MDIFKVINLDILHTYSNIDFSTLNMDVDDCHVIAKLDYNKFSMFIDIFDDVNKREHNDSPNPHFTFADNILYIIYNNEFLRERALTDEQQMKILFKLLVRNFKECNNRDSHNNPKGYYSYNVHKNYFNKYYDTIINLFRLTNDNTIEICNLNDSVVDAIRVLLLMAKTRVLPKYIILHKILLFYLLPKN